MNYSVVLCLRCGSSRYVHDIVESGLEYRKSAETLQLLNVGVGVCMFAQFAFNLRQDVQDLDKEEKFYSTHVFRVSMSHPVSICQDGVGHFE